MFETSAETAKLDAALAKAQGEIEPAVKDKVNPAFKSKYADLSACWAAIRPALSKHGISLTQWPVHSDDGRMHLVTRLAHDGQWMRCEFSIPVSKPDAHGHGSAITYLKRFSLSACLGLVADDDDDGNGASGTGGSSGAMDALGVVVKALEAEDGWALLDLSWSRREDYMRVFGKLNMKQKSLSRELEQKASTQRAEYIEQISAMALADDQTGATQLLAELTDKTRKKLVWDGLDENTQAWIKNLKKEAA